MTTDDQLRDYPFETFRGELPDELLDMVSDQPISRVRLPDGRPTWLVLGYDEVRTVLADPRFSRREGEAESVATDEPGCPAGHRPTRELAVDNAAPH